jgi:hypothetical protein
MWNAERGIKGRVCSRVMPAAFCILLVGCAYPAPTTQPTSGTHQRQQKALADPFGYSPEFGNTDVSGGGISDFDRGGFERDMNNVLDP